MNLKDKIIYFKFKRGLRKMQRKYNAEKRRCARTYPDWKDDEYNDLDYKFIWGLSHNPKAESYASFHTWNKAALIFDRRAKEYILELDTTFFDNEINAHYIRYINEIREAFNQHFKDILNPPIDTTFTQGLFRDKSIAGIKRKLDMVCTMLNLNSKGEL